MKDVLWDKNEPRWLRILMFPFKVLITAGFFSFVGFVALLGIGLAVYIFIAVALWLLGITDALSPGGAS